MPQVQPEEEKKKKKGIGDGFELKIIVNHCLLFPHV